MVAHTGRGGSICAIARPARALSGCARRRAASSTVCPGRPGGSFRSPVGVTPWQWLDYFWRGVREEAGLQDVRLHDTRHTYASMALLCGESVRIVGRLLGHERASTTLKYAHLSDATVREAVETLSPVLSGRQDMKGRRVRLTDAGVGKLKPDTTEYAVWDSEVPGLGLRVRPSGHRSFVWHGRVRGEPVRTTVGPAALMTVEDARKASPGVPRWEPPHARRKGVPAFPCSVTSSLTTGCQRTAAAAPRRPIQFANRVLERQLISAFGRLPLDAIRRIDVERWFDAYSRTAPGGANKALEIFGQIMNAALAAGYAGDRPRQRYREEPPPETHPVPLRRRDRKASPRPRSAGRRTGPPAGNKPTSSGCSCLPAAGRARS